MISVPTYTIGGDGGWSITWPVCELAFEKSSAELVDAGHRAKSQKLTAGATGPLL